MKIATRLKELGFDEPFAQAAGLEKLDRFDLARVVSVHKDRYTITDGERDIHAELVGKMVYGAAAPEDFPTVGDWVLSQVYDDGNLAVIHEIVPRKSLLKRKTSGKNVESQLIAANVDTALLMQSLDENFNLRRLERYLVMVHESKIQPVVLLSKSDLRAEEEIASKVAAIRSAMVDLEVQPFSNKSRSSLDRVRRLLVAGQTYCLLGSSGVGKTTLINMLCTESVSATRAVREKDAKGRHTTTRRDLIRVKGGAMIVDNPGMREFGILSAVTGLSAAFVEIAGWARHCRFGDCTHVNEQGCAVLDALEKGLLTEKRYQNYIKMSKESAFNEMSYLEKRKKDKQFAKLCKSVMKRKKYRR